MSEHDWLIGKEFIDVHDSGNHVIRVVGISTSHVDYIFVKRVDQLYLASSARQWERNAHVVIPMILLHELTEATRPMIIDMIERGEDENDSGEKHQDVTDVILALNNVKEWQEAGAWKRS